MNAESDIPFAPRVAIVGSTSPIGRELRQTLEDHPGRWPLTMLDTDEYAGLLQEFSGEIEIVQVISPDRLEEADVAVFACAPRFLYEYLDSGAYLPPVTVDLTGGERVGPIYVDGVSPEGQSRQRGPVIAPRAGTIVIARILERLHTDVGVVSSEATVLESASECGGQAMDTLQQETIQVLNFQTSRERAGQRAFNLIGPDAASDRRAARVARQIGSISGDGCRAPALRFVSVPLFQGEAVSMHVRLREDLSVEDVVRALTRDSLTVQSDSPLSPLEVLGTDRIHLAHVGEGADENTFWLWIVTDNMRVAARNALELIRKATLLAE